MATYNNQNQGNTYFKPSTDAVTLYSGDTMLRITYYDTTMSLEFRKATTDAEGKRRFPKPEKGKEVNIVLSADKVAAISDILHRDFIPVLEKLTDKWKSNSECSEEHNIAVMGNQQGTKLLVISTGKPTDKGYEPEITLYTDIGEDRIPGNTVTFKTSSVPVLIDYNDKTGDFAVLSTLPQFYIIINVFHNFIEAMTKTYAHFNKSREMVSMNDVIERIAMSLNVPVQTRSSYGSEYSSGGSKVNNFANATITYEESSLEDMLK